MNVASATEGFLYSSRSGTLSPATADNYQSQLKRFIEWYGDRDIETITSRDLDEYLNRLQRTEYQKTKDTVGTLSLSSVVSHYRTIRALFAWLAQEQIVGARPDTVKARKAPQALVEPFTEDEVKKILKACEYTHEVKPDGKRPYTMKRPTHLRDKAMVLMLLDTGLRVGELSRLTIGDVNMASGEISVKPWLSGKKSMARHVYLGATSKTALWKYLDTRKQAHKDHPLFKSTRGGGVDRHSVARLLEEMGERAGVPGVHPHRFRHTYAIEALRNGMDIFTLQTNLGHSSLAMVRYYLTIAKSDQKAAQERTSPADHWRLRP
jgi:integrase/recombinase XerD